MCRPNPPGIELYCYVNILFCFRWKNRIECMNINSQTTEITQIRSSCSIPSMSLLNPYPTRQNYHSYVPKNLPFGFSVLHNNIQYCAKRMQTNFALFATFRRNITKFRAKRNFIRTSPNFRKAYCFNQNENSQQPREYSSEISS